jgi:RNA polymerase sigma-70 factor (ECF subfamily)
MDRTELAAVFQRYGALVFRRAFVLLGNRVDAEDAAQEVFVRAYKSAEHFRAESQASTWLYQITTSSCLNLLRDRRRRAELFQEHIATLLAPLPGAPEVGDMMVLRKLLHDADEELARAAIYVYVDGMTHEEVSEVLGVSRRTVGSSLERFNTWAREQLAAPKEPRV